MRNQTTLPVMMMALWLGGCAAEDPLPIDDGLQPPPAGQGIQFRMESHIEGGSEVELCKFVVAPPEGLWVARDELRFDPGSHHVLVYETSYEAIPDAKDDGTPVDTSGVFDCSDGATNGWSVTGLVAGSQNFDGASGIRFPPGVALRVPGDAVLMMNAHYVNTAPEAIDPEVRVNLWTMPEAEVVEEGDILFWYNIFIKVPGQGSASARMRCQVPEDITLMTAQSHMHRRGTGYEATVVGQQMPFYMNDQWEGVPVADYGEGMPIAGGSTVEYHCDYDNGETHDVYQGPRSSDEMCMLVGAYYPAVPGLSFCAADPERPIVTNALGAEWIGNGQASCAETVACVQAFEGDFFQNLQGCVTNSDPAVSGPVSDAVRCLLLSFADGEDPTEACAAEIGSCMEQ